jgi:hypothetical protein
MRRTVGCVFLLLVLLPAVLVTLAAPAQEPKEKIARVSFAQGDTSYQRGDDEEWNALGSNTPIMTGDSLYAAEDGRLEVDLGTGNVVRLDNSTALDLVNLTSEITQVGLSQGHLNMRVRAVPANRTVEINTPLAAATFWEPGMYRVDAEGDRVHFGVVIGSLSVILDGEQLDVRPGEVLEIQGDRGYTYAYGSLPQASAFDRWSENRDMRRHRSRSSHYVHSAVMGYDDLDDNGSWSQDPTYGNVWQPSHVSNDWAPYQAGRWMWQDPYGWTWVSYEPWGWAPYHYGRWVHVGHRWCWVPPPPVGYRAPRAVRNIRPIYSPSLVVFVGGHNWNVGVSVGGGGGGGMGWFPLGPSDPYYYPWQRPTHVTNVVYQNIYINNSVTVVNYNNFGTGVVTRIPVGLDGIRRAAVMGPRVTGITPGRGSLAPYPGVKLPPRAIPGKAVRDRPFVVRSTPPPKPVPFQTKVKEIKNTGKPYARPVALGVNVGKPFKPGMKTPDGVKVKSALGPTVGGPKAPKLKAKDGQEARPPKAIVRDVARPPKVDKPDRPDKPPKADKPVQPDKPPKADKPVRPDKPPKADKPVRPDNPPKADKPVRPDKPPKADKPVRPDNPPKADKPVRPDKLPKADKPVRPDKPPKADKPVRPDQPPKADKPVRPDKPPKADKPIRPDQPPEAANPVRPDKPPKADKPVRPDKPPKADKPVRPDNRQNQPEGKPNIDRPEKPTKPEGAAVTPKKPIRPDAPPASDQEKKKDKEIKDDEK